MNKEGRRAAILAVLAAAIGSSAFGYTVSSARTPFGGAGVPATSGQPSSCGGVCGAKTGEGGGAQSSCGSGSCGAKK